jgi:hypothetical protein
VIVEPIAWIAEYAARKGLKYQPDADERWIRVWEPYATLKTPHRYEHVLEHTGESGSVTIARMLVTMPVRGPDNAWVEGEAGAWIAIAQDVGVKGRAAATTETGQIFGDALDLVAMPRRTTGDPTFDDLFASFAPTSEDLALAITPSVRKLAVSWHVPLHFEIRPGGFILAPIALAADPASLSWFVRAVYTFGEKAAKRLG